jgi:polyisoprenoid-binding protein YceI
MPTTEEQLIAQGTWNVDAGHSTVEFHVKHLGISTFKGFFKEFEGTLEVGPTLGESKAYGKVVVDSIDTRNEGRDDHLKTGDFFEGETYPEITFASTALTAGDDGELTIAGDLTIRGVTKPIELTATIGGAETDPWGNARVGVEATTTILRSDYGMSFNQSLTSGSLLLSDKVKIVLSLSAIKAA